MQLHGEAAHLDCCSLYTVNLGLFFVLGEGLFLGLPLFIMRAHIHTHVHILSCVYGGQNTAWRSQFSPSTL